MQDCTNLYLFSSPLSTSRMTRLLSLVTAYLVPYRRLLSSLCQDTLGLGSEVIEGKLNTAACPAWTCTGAVSPDSGKFVMTENII